MYKIAVATSDGVNVNLHFGSTEVFLIYSVDGEQIDFLESRKVVDNPNIAANCNCDSNGCNGNNKGSKTCGGEKSEVVDALLDCRAVVCTQIGRNILKQLERHAISSFDVSMPISDALQRIASYYYKIDNRLYGKQIKQ